MTNYLCSQKLQSSSCHQHLSSYHQHETWKQLKTNLVLLASIIIIIIIIIYNHYYYYFYSFFKIVGLLSHKYTEINKSIYTNLYLDYITSKWTLLESFFFFLYLGFLPWPFTNHKTAREGEGRFFNSLITASTHVTDN